MNARRIGSGISGQIRDRHCSMRPSVVVPGIPGTVRFAIRNASTTSPSLTLVGAADLGLPIAGGTGAGPDELDLTAPDCEKAGLICVVPTLVAGARSR